MILYNAEQFAKILGVSPQRVRALAKVGRCGTKVGRDWAFTKRDIDKCQVRKPGKPRK